MGKNAHIQAAVNISRSGVLSQDEKTTKPGAPPGYERWEGPVQKAQQDDQRWPGLGQYQGPPATSQGWQPPPQQAPAPERYHNVGQYGDTAQPTGHYNGVPVVSQSHSVYDPRQAPPVPPAGVPPFDPNFAPPAGVPHFDPNFDPRRVH